MSTNYIPTYKSSQVTATYWTSSTGLGRYLLDSIVGLPPFNGNWVIMAVIDLFPKASHFGFYNNDLQIKPYFLWTDTLVEFWTTLFKLNGTKLPLSTAYHPEGQTEVLNRMLITVTSCLIHNKPSICGKLLHWAKWHYNTSVHNKVLLISNSLWTISSFSKRLYAGSSNLEAIASLMMSWDKVISILKSNLLKAQQWMKDKPDLYRIDTSYSMSD